MLNQEIGKNQMIDSIMIVVNHYDGDYLFRLTLEHILYDIIDIKKCSDIFIIIHYTDSIQNYLKMKLIEAPLDVVLKVYNYLREYIKIMK